MQSLPELQHRFGNALRGGAIEGLALRDRGLSGGQRLQVYRNNHVTALREALRAGYPVIERLVGEAFFAAAADTYVAANPSRSGNIQDYGDAFPEFLSGYAPAQSLSYLGDVAALERTRLQAAIAPPHPPMDLKALAEVSAETLPALHFRCQPAVQILGSYFPILSIWEFCQQEEPQGVLDLDKGTERVLFSRPRLDVEMRLISPGEYAFLKVLCRGDSFESACQAALELEPAFDVEESFATLVRDEILTSFYL